VEDIEYFSDTFKAIQIFQNLGFELFIVTNQSGVGRGYFSLESVYVIHKQLQNDLRENKLQPFKDFAICPHSPDDECRCRKPHPQMLLELAEKYKIDLKKSYMIGDKLIDAECGKNAGTQGIIVRQTTTNTDFPFHKTLLDFAKTLQS